MTRTTKTIRVLQNGGRIVESDNKLLYEHNDFIGSLLVGAKGCLLKDISKTSDTPRFLGKVCFKDDPGMIYFYFKDHVFQTKNTPTFTPTKQFLSHKYYYFHVTQVRLRNDFSYIAYHYENQKIIHYNEEPIIGKHVNAMFLLNIHTEADGSLEEHIYLYPNEHLKTNNLPKEVFLDAFEEELFRPMDNSTEGCDTMVSANSRLILFKRQGNVDDYTGGNEQPIPRDYTEEYFLLTRGTDNVASFCVGNTKSSNFSKVSKNIERILKSAYDYKKSDKKLGIANKMPKKFQASRFGVKDRYGLHILEESGWKSGKFEHLNYSSQINPDQ